MGNIKLKKIEIRALIQAADQMKDDLEDYVHFMPKRERERFLLAYQTGMQKLRDEYNKK